MLISVISVHIGRGIPMNLGEKQDLVDELRRQIELCARQVDAYSNKRDKNAKNMWYYWYGRTGRMRADSRVYPKQNGTAGS